MAQSKYMMLVCRICEAHICMYMLDLFIGSRNRKQSDFYHSQPVLLFPDRNESSKCSEIRSFTRDEDMGLVTIWKFFIQFFIFPKTRVQISGLEIKQPVCWISRKWNHAWELRSNLDTDGYFILVKPTAIENQWRFGIVFYFIAWYHLSFWYVTKLIYLTATVSEMDGNSKGCGCDLAWKRILCGS